MSLNLNKYTKLAKITYKEYEPDIEDIIIFGSAMKGKDNPKDTDIIIIFKRKINKDAEYKLRNAFRKAKIEGAEINSVTLSDLRSGNFAAAEGIYLEGYSLLRKKKISEEMSFSSLGLITYDVSAIKGSRRIMFYYALQGRNNSKGVLHDLDAGRFSDNVLICPYDKIEQAKQFFESWKIPYTIMPALVPSRLRNILIKEKE